MEPELKEACVAEAYDAHLNKLFGTGSRHIKYSKTLGRLAFKGGVGAAGEAAEGAAKATGSGVSALPKGVPSSQIRANLARQGAPSYGYASLPKGTSSSQIRSNVAGRSGQASRGRGAPTRAGGTGIDNPQAPPRSLTEAPPRPGNTMGLRSFGGSGNPASGATLGSPTAGTFRAPVLRSGINQTVGKAVQNRSPWAQRVLAGPSYNAAATTAQDVGRNTLTRGAAGLAGGYGGLQHYRANRMSGAINKIPEMGFGNRLALAMMLLMNPEQIKQQL